ncbi:MAG: MoxR family ATPase [Planctomycetota bacterium]
MVTDVKQIEAKVKATAEPFHRLMARVAEVIVGQEQMVERIMQALLCDGHVLLEGVPGLAKTLTVRMVAAALDTGFKRIQFTPDLLPADIIGTQIFNPRTGEFTMKKGPIFTNIVLADEINRAPAKVQSALLEAMQERQVTIGDTTHPLPRPFIVLATQNPIEQEGTYPLPEAQVDRFIFKVVLDYPTMEEEKIIMHRMAATGLNLSVARAAGPEDIFKAREVVNEIYLDAKVGDYIVDIVTATRTPEKYKLDIGRLIEYGASPRATINLNLAARAHAFLQGRGYVTPQDIKSVGPDVLRHRVIVSYEAEAEEITAADLVARIFETVPVP